MATTETVLEWRFACPTELCGYASELIAGLPTVDAVQQCYADGDDGIERPFELAVYGRDPSLTESLAGVLAQDDLLAAHVAGGLRQTTIVESDWANAWRQYWHTTRMTPRLTVRPSWEAYEATDPDERVIVLDPGSAFGTGAHDTTRLMLTALDDEAQAHPPNADAVLLDVGTGSGILAIAGALLGWQTVWALDNDPHAVTIARQNVTENALTDRIDWFAGTLDESPFTGPADCIVANILGPVLVALAPEFAARLKPGGVLWCSGLIDSSARDVAEALTVHGFHAITRRTENHWVALRAERA